MIRSLLHRAIRHQERALAAPMDYMRDIADSSPAAFIKFALIAPLGLHRRTLQLEPWHLARVAAAFSEDCGTCAQIAITLARRDGVPAKVLRAVVSDSPEQLSAPLQDVYRFTRAMVERSDDPELRERIRSHYSQDALVELSLAIAVSRVIPTIKRALGHATACSVLRFELSAPAPAPGPSR